MINPGGVSDNFGRLYTVGRLPIALAPSAEEGRGRLEPKKATANKRGPLPVLHVSSSGVVKHGQINHIDTKEKCCHLKKLTCKGTLLQVFI
jgi:hypothetical protein